MNQVCEVTKLTSDADVQIVIHINQDLNEGSRSDAWKQENWADIAALPAIVVETER